MKIELRNVKHAKFASEETECFEATIYIDGVKAGTAENAGHGGPTTISPYSLEKKIKTFTDTLPPTSYEGVELEMTPELYIDNLMYDWQIETSLKRKMKNRIMFTKFGKVGIFETKRMVSEQLAALLANPPRTWEASQILNHLPIADALVIYKANTEIP